MNNSTRPLRARNLHSSSHSQPDTRISKQSSISTAVQTEIKVQIGAVLVRSCQAILRAQGVSICRAEVGDLNDDGVSSVGEGVAGTVGLGGQLPAGSASWTGACAGTYAKGVLRKSGGITGLQKSVCWVRHHVKNLGAYRSVETTSGGLGVAVATSESITAAVLSEGCLVGCATATTTAGGLRGRDRSRGGL